MTRPLFIAISMTLLTACGHPDKSKDGDILARAREIHKRVITLDTHVDIQVKNFSDTVNYTQRLDTQVNLPKMEEGGLDVAWFIVYTGQDSLTRMGYERAAANAMAKFEAIHRLCEEFAPEAIGLALAPTEVEQLQKAGKKVAMIGVENAYPMGTDLGNFERYHRLGARYISLAHNGHSQFCDSHTGEASGQWLHNGLSPLGRQAVEEMNRLGIMIDVSHVSKEAMMQICELTEAPIIASHSSARALCDHSRNLDDEQLDRIKALGGVVQTVALDAYLNTKKHAAREKYMEPLFKKAADSLGLPWYNSVQLDSLTESETDAYYDNYPRVKALAAEYAKMDTEAPEAVGVTDLVDHIDYMVARMGIDHVGISSDFDGGGGIEGWQDASDTFNVTLEMVRRGYTDEEIAKLWSGNLLRVLQEVQEYAAQGKS